MNELEKKEKQKGELAEEIEKEFYDPVDHLSPKQQKYALKKVTTTLSDGEIAQSLGLSDYKRRKLEKNEHVQEYVNYLQKKYSDKEIVETERRQIRFIREEFFNELMERFMQDPEEAAREYFGTVEGEIDATQSEIEDFRKRFAKHAKFKDFVKSFDKIDDMRRLDEGQATDRVDDGAIENQAREKYAKLKRKRTRKKFMDEQVEDALNDGVESFEEFEEKYIEDNRDEIEKESSNKENSNDDEEEVIEAELVDDENKEKETEVIEETIVEEFEIGE